jgi:hypothetical protein
VNVSSLASAIKTTCQLFVAATYHAGLFLVVIYVLPSVAAVRALREADYFHAAVFLTLGNIMLYGSIAAMITCQATRVAGG